MANALVCTRLPVRQHGVWFHGLINHTPIQLEIVKDFEFNGRFDIKQSSIVSDSEILFDNVVETALAKGFHTLAGKSFYQNTVIHGENAVTMRYALRRMFCKREVGKIGYDRRMRDNQHIYIRNNKEHIIRDFQKAFGPTNYCTTPEEDSHFLSLLPHSKRAARELTHLANLSNGQLFMKKWSQIINGKEIDKIMFKIKPTEIAKYQKYGRIIVDLGMGNSLQAAVWAELVKCQMATYEVHINGCKLIFCKKPKPELLDSIFNEARDHDYRMIFWCFSDDACASIKTENGYRFFNMDITGNDTSYTTSFKNLFLDIFQCCPLVRMFLETQFESDIKIRHPSPIELQHNIPKERRHVNVSPLDFYLQSGNGITTGNNTMGQMNIGRCITFIDFNNFTVEDISKAFENIGFTSDVTEVEFEGLQFLKHSPVLCDDGEYHAVLNYAVAIRASGRCKGNLPGSGPIEARWGYYQHTLITGMSKRYKCELFEVLRPNKPISYYKDQLKKSAQVAIENSIFDNLKYKLGLMDSEQVTREYLKSMHYNYYKEFYAHEDEVEPEVLSFSSSAYMYKHKCEELIDEHLQFCREADFGDMIYSQLADIVLKNEYGVDNKANFPDQIRHPTDWAVVEK